MLKKEIIIATLLVLMGTKNIFAAPPSLSPGEMQEIQRQQGHIIQQQEEMRRRQMEEFRSRQSTVPDGYEQSLLPQVPKQGDAACLQVKSIALQGATLLSKSTLRRAVAPYENSCLTLDDINALLRDISNEYIEQGYVTSRAFVAPSQEDNGVLNVLIVEGKIEKIILNDGDRNMLYRGKTAFPHLEGNALNLRDIEQGLDQLSRLPSQDATMELEPGEAVGGTVVKVTTKTGRSWRLGAGMDTLGQRSTGRTQYNLSLEKDNLVGLGDQFFVNWSADAPGLEKVFYGGKQPGHNRNFSTYASIPWGYWTFFTSFSRFVYATTVAGISEDYTSSGDTVVFSGQAERVIHRDASSKTSFSLSMGYRDVNSYFEDVLLEVSSYRLSTLGASLSHNRRMLGGVAGLQLEYTRGLSVWGATKALDSKHNTPRSQFNKYSASLSWYRPFALFEQDFFWNLSARGQYSPETLYSAERMQIGGKYSVRGFHEDSISGESGGYVRNELGYNLPWVNSLRDKGPVNGVQAYVGYDIGALVRDKKSSYERGRMEGVAFGLRTLGDLSVDASIAKPLHHPSFISKVRDPEYYLSVRYMF